MPNDLLDLGAHRLKRDAEGLKRLCGDSFALVDQPKQDVLGADVVVIEQASFFLRKYDDSSCSVSKAFKHLRPPLVAFMDLTMKSVSLRSIWLALTACSNCLL
ncbi:unannotated protein [freshwater metagenome]|uniref:Unannotated protein n=1 Tax=freshwater metagenome TaxID=449393 RepID=A0A6J6VWW4_9ZZZZ